VFEFTSSFLELFLTQRHPPFIGIDGWVCGQPGEKVDVLDRFRQSAVKLQRGSVLDCNTRLVGEGQESGCLLIRDLLARVRKVAVGTEQKMSANFGQ
jgi:hypothetical protein